MAKEIERKFLVRSDMWRDACETSTEFRQAYIAAMDDRSVRVRLMAGTRATLTLKIGRNTMSRDEFEYSIPVQDALDMIGCAVGIVIEKTRHTLTYEGYLWEIDVYDGVYAGLVVAEVELTHEGEMPRLPAWLGPEVTGDRRYSNHALATEPPSVVMDHELSFSR